MASPVDTSVKHFTFEMFGAPVLNGQAGSALGMLDACLVTGFGLKAATSLTVAGGVATLAFSGQHAATVESVVLVEGVTGALAGLNGEQKVTALGTGTVRFATALPDGTAAGTVTFKMAPAGWAKVFSDTNVAVYRSPTPESTRMFLRVDDTGTTAFRWRGFESMTDANTGVGGFPLDAQISGGGWCNKSNSANATPVKWTLVSDARGGYLNVTGFSSTTAAVESGRTCFFGDFQALRAAGDPYAFALGCGVGGGAGETSGVCDGDNGANTYLPRAFHGLGGSVKASAISESGATVTSGKVTTFGAFPSEVDGGLMLSRRFLGDISAAPRGVLPGLYVIPQFDVGLSVPPRSFQIGAGVLAGRKLISLGCGENTNPYPSTGLGISMVDITGPWAR